MALLAQWVPAGSFDRLSSPQALWAAWVEYRRGKRRRAHVARFDLDADRQLFGLHRALRDGAWRPGPWRMHVQREPKPRCIAVSPVLDRVLNQALIAEIGPHFSRSFVDRSYACKTGRGTHRALLRALGDLRRFRWRLHLDVRGYFAHVSHERLLALYHARLKDPHTLSLLEAIVRYGGVVYQTPLARRVAKLPDDHPADRGMPVGSLVSHFSGALYLDGLDHRVLRHWKPGGWVRFMDDLLLFDDDRARLVALHAEIAEWLHVERGLTLNDTREGVVSTAAGLVCLGHRLTPAGIFPGPKQRRRLRRAARRASGPSALEDVLRRRAPAWMFG